MTYIYPNVRVYALERALAAAIARSEDRKADTALIDSQAAGNG